MDKKAEKHSLLLDTVLFPHIGWRILKGRWQRFLGGEGVVGWRRIISLKGAYNEGIKTFFFYLFHSLPNNRKIETIFLNLTASIISPTLFLYLAI